MKFSLPSAHPAHSLPSGDSPLRKNLRRLMVLRMLVVLGQGMTLAAVYHWLELSLPYASMLAVVTILALLNFLTALRLRKPWPVGDAEFFAQLLFDVAALTALLYYSGGSANPFVSLYLLPLIIAATTLPLAYAWAMALLTIACYSVLMSYNVPLPQQHRHDASGEAFNLHVLGMWLTFVGSALLIAWFVVRMNASIRERDRLLEQARIEVMRNEQIVALGALAAGAAHELGTPLATMAVVTRELQNERPQDDDLQHSLDILRGQVEHCKGVLNDLLAHAGQKRAEGGRVQTLDDFLNEVLGKWQLMRPSVRFDYRVAGDTPAPRIVAEQTLSQSILNLLNNAADASPDSVEIESRWSADELQLEIRDRGAGLNDEALAQAGRAFFTNKAPGQGFGIGLFLANANIERFGGTVRLFNREGGGACTQVMLPLAILRADAA
ncbi:MAG: ATP-binding protein [Pseudomonadota bacterium]